ncbi:hypothetical protein GQS_01280 [Thermococcus sp. 4557]|nr:hypothetical protein GQS_01280 [Thermococcus sp. 4557]
MAAITVRPPTLKKMEALGFSLMIVAAVLMVAAVWGGSHGFQGDVMLNPGEYYLYTLSGHQWSTIYFSIKSTQPVTICITDETGVEMLKSGESPLCFFRAEDTTSIEKIWRFPEKGPLYLVLVPAPGTQQTRVSITVKSGLVLW